jgi:hypothetical protein
VGAEDREVDAQGHVGLRLYTIRNMGCDDDCNTDLQVRRDAPFLMGLSFSLLVRSVR